MIKQHQNTPRLGIFYGEKGFGYVLHERDGEEDGFPADQSHHKTNTRERSNINLDLRRIHTEWQHTSPFRGEKPKANFSSSLILRREHYNEYIEEFLTLS